MRKIATKTGLLQQEIPHKEAVRRVLTAADMAVLRRKLTCDDDRLPTSMQHVTPCAGCPWTKHSLKGYLGSMTVDDWIQKVHGEHVIDCHNTTNRQCAGAAIFRANVFKSPRNPLCLRLPSSKKLAFSTDAEFREHHSKVGV